MDSQLAHLLREWLADDERREQGLLSVGYQGAAYLFGGELDGQPVRYVLKRAAQGRFTAWIHSRMLGREARAYGLLAVVNGVPHSPGLLDGEWLVLDYIEGQPLKQLQGQLRDPQSFYTRLHRIIRACHAVGVAHGDLKRKDNILVAADEQPVVIDFGTAVLRDGTWLERRLFPLACRLDHNAWIKAKYGNNPAAISRDDARWFRPTWIENGLRPLRRLWRMLTLRQLRKRRQRAARRDS